MSDFADACADLVARFGPGRLRALADRWLTDCPRQNVLAAVPVPGFAEAAAAVLDAAPGSGMSHAQAVGYLRGVAAGYAQRADAVRVETVFSGPASHPVPVRATGPVLTELVAGARRELLLMTYSARGYPPLHDALAAAVERGVHVTVVVETLQGAGSAMSGPEPAAAFAAVRGIDLWHWPVEQRADAGAKLHAKLAVADRHTLLLSSANLTQSGVGRNIEAGLLVRGGGAPARVAEHVDELAARGVLARLHASGTG